LNPRIWSFFSLSNFDSFVLHHANNTRWLNSVRSCAGWGAVCMIAAGESCRRPRYCLDAPPANSGQTSARPGEGRMRCSNCNGENKAGSRQKTQYLVGILAGPRWVAQALQQLYGFLVRSGGAGKIARARKG